MTPSWHLVSYDIAQPRRGQRVYRRIRKSGLFLLESLYLCEDTGQGMATLLAELRKLAGPSARDVVSYRLRPGQPIHAFGTACPHAGIRCFGMPDIKAHAVATNAD